MAERFFPAWEQKAGEGEEAERRSTMGGEEATQSGLVDKEVDLDGSFVTETELIGAEREDSRSGAPGDAASLGDGGEMEAAAPLGRPERGEPEERRAGLGHAGLDVCLGPLEESGALVRIPLEEAERYSRLCRRCRWLCGKTPLGL